MLQLACEGDVVKDTGKDEYRRQFIHIGLHRTGLFPTEYNRATFTQAGI